MNKKIAFCLYSWPCVAPHTLISLHFWHTLVKLDIKKASLSWRARTHKLQKYSLCLVKQTGNPLQNHKEYSQHNVNMFIDFNKYKVWNQNAVAKPENIILIWFGCETPCYHKKKKHQYWLPQITNTGQTRRSAAHTGSTRHWMLNWVTGVKESLRECSTAQSCQMASDIPPLLKLAVI